MKCIIVKKKIDFEFFCFFFFKYDFYIFNSILITLLSLRWPEYLLILKIFEFKVRPRSPYKLGQVFGHHHIKGNSLSFILLSNLILYSTYFFLLMFTKALILCLCLWLDKSNLTWASLHQELLPVSVLQVSATIYGSGSELSFKILNVVRPDHINHIYHY